MMEAESKEAELRVCKKCLIQDIPQGRSLDIYIQQISPDMKASDELYQTRLSLCKQCDSLMNGMCRICGCFVEVRAAVKNSYCPGTEKRW